MLEKLFERITQAFEPSGKKLSRISTKPASAGKERRKKSRSSAQDRRKSKLRMQEWGERDKTRLKSGLLHWEGYP